MKHQYLSVNHKLYILIIIFLLSGMLFSIPPVEAQQTPERSWQFWLGGGGFMEPVYPGSDALYVKPVPFVNAVYHFKSLDLFASMIDGIGIRYKKPEFAGLDLSVAINPLGNERDPKLRDVKRFMISDVDDVNAFLEGTPTIKNYIEYFGTLKIDVLPFTSLSTTVSYFPTKADYRIYPDKTYNGVTASLDLQSGYQLTPRIILQGGLGVTWMDDDYSEAFHSVLYSTSNLNRFVAKSGISDVHGGFTFINFFSEHYGAMVFGNCSLLLGDAADSPLTKTTFQPEMGVMIFYNF